MEYFVADTYKNCERVGEPFARGGKLYTGVREACPRCGGAGRISAYGHVEGGVCYKCNGGAFLYREVRLYTEKEKAAMDKAAETRARRKAEEEELRQQNLMEHSEENRQAWLENHGFNKEGQTWVAFGNTYDNKDELKALGCKFADFRAWVADEPKDVPAGCGMVVISFDDIYEWRPLLQKAFLKNGAKDFVDTKCREANGQDSTSEFVGEVKQRLRDLPVEIVAIRGFEGQYGHTNVYTFDYEGNQLVWFTSSSIANAEAGQKFLLTGTVKEHKEYNGIKQTMLSRCIVKGE